MNLTIRHRELIAAVNTAKTEFEHAAAEAFLRGWRAGIGDAHGGEPGEFGESTWFRILDWTDADLHHDGTPNEGRPMSIGIFLDWQPNKSATSATGIEA